MPRRDKLLVGLILLLMVFLIKVPSVLSQPLSLDIEVKIIPYEFTDAYVVGDSFYYQLDINNGGNVTINDTFRIYVLTPNGRIIENVQEYNVSLNPNAALKITAKGGKENENAAFPFETAGDYHLILNSTQPIDFYRRFLTKDGHLLYVRQPSSFEYFFDVMPHWQYTLWKQTSEANTKMIEANDKLLSLTADTKKATDTIKVATIVMLIVALIQLSTTLFVEGRKGRIFDVIKGFLKLIAWCVIILLFFVILILILNACNITFT